MCVCLPVCLCASVCTSALSVCSVGGHTPRDISPLFFFFFFFFHGCLVKHHFIGAQFRGDNEHRSIRRGDNKAKCDTWGGGGVEGGCLTGMRHRGGKMRSRGKGPAYGINLFQSGYSQNTPNPPHWRSSFSRIYVQSLVRKHRSVPSAAL